MAEQLVTLESPDGRRYRTDSPSEVNLLVGSVCPGCHLTDLTDLTDAPEEGGEAPARGFGQGASHAPLTFTL